MTEQEYNNNRDTLFKEIARCAFASYNFFHRGMDEITYEAGLKVELENCGKEVYRQSDFPIYYKGMSSGVNRRMDLVVKDDKLGFIILELKAIERVGETQRQQLWSYMRLLNIHLGMLINFSNQGVYYESYQLNEETGQCDRV